MSYRFPLHLNYVRSFYYEYISSQVLAQQLTEYNDLSIREEKLHLIEISASYWRTTAQTEKTKA